MKNWLLKLCSHMVFADLDPSLEVMIVQTGENGLTLLDLAPLKRALNEARQKNKKTPTFWIQELEADPFVNAITSVQPGEVINALSLQNVIRQLQTGLGSSSPSYIPLSQLLNKLNVVTDPKFINKQQRRMDKGTFGKVTYFNIDQQVTNYTRYGLKWQPWQNKPLAATLQKAFPNALFDDKSQKCYISINAGESELNPDQIRTLVEIFRQHGYNTKIIESFSNTESSDKIQKGKISLEIEVLPERTNWHLSVPMSNFASLESGPGFDFMQIITPFCVETKSVPKKKYPSSRARKIDQTSYYRVDADRILLKASHPVYEHIIYLLGVKGFDIRQLQSAVSRGLAGRNDFQRGRILPGQLGGYFIDAKTNDPFPYGEEIERILVRVLGMTPRKNRPDVQDVKAIKSYHSSLYGMATKIVGNHPKEVGIEAFWPREQQVQNILKIRPDLSPEEATRIAKELEDAVYKRGIAVRNTKSKKVKGKRQAFDGTFWWDMLQYTIRKTGQEDSKIKPMQGRDIMWLYSQPSAILGDQCGAGKTIQSIIAADLRTKGSGEHPFMLTSGELDENGYPELVPVDQFGQPSTEIQSIPITNRKFIVGSEKHKKAFDPSSGKFYDPTPEMPGNPIGGGKVLIFTLNGLEEQWAEEIKAATGAPREIISTSIEDMIKKGVDKSKWLILPYSALNKNTEDEQNKENKRTNNTDTNDAKETTGKGGKSTRTNIVRRNMAFLSSVDFDVMIIDESHKVKDPTSNRSRNIAAVGLSVPYKWGLTATYAANTPQDLSHQAITLGHPIGNYKLQTEGLGMSKDATHAQNFLRIIRRTEPDFDSLNLQDKIDFAIEYAETMPIDGLSLKQRSDNQVNEILYINSVIILTDFYHRKTKKEIEPNMPEHTIKVEEIDPDLNLDILADVEQQMIVLQQQKALENEAKGKPIPDKRSFEREAIAIAKAPETAKLARKILAQGQKVIVFSAFKKAANRIYEEINQFLEPRDFKTFITTGDSTKFVYETNENGEREKVSLKQKQLDQFKTDPNVKAYVFMAQSSGTGMDLPNVTEHVIVNDFTYVPAEFDQIEGRADRVTRHIPLTTHYMVIDKSKDKAIYANTQKKRFLSDQAQNIDRAYAEKLRTNQPVNKEVEAAKENHWELVKANIIEEIIHEEYGVSELEEPSQIAPSMVAWSDNWLKKLAQPIY